MTTQRKLARVITLPPPSRGQFGPDHKAIEVIRPNQWADNDPFILLMDDRLDGRLVAGPHPHAGFETVTFLVDGEMAAESGFGQLQPGDVEWTTAGKGIIHGPDATVEGRMRVLQLWLTLPKKDRWAEPDHQFISADEAPVRREPGAELRLFSGTTGELRSPTRNHVPVTLVDVRLDPGASVEQELPASFNGFLYVLDGAASVGVDGQSLEVGQIGWLNLPSEPGSTSLRIANPGQVKLRVLLYAAERQNDSIVWYGPFIGDSREDIARSFEGYRAGTFRKY
jgi:redox-sensitive bicupin YhaK (pirin superfamily)